MDGARWVYLAEQDPEGLAPLRFEFVPVTARSQSSSWPRTKRPRCRGLRMFYANWGGMVIEFEDVQGLVGGLDLACGRGPLTRTSRQRRPGRRL